MILVHFSEIKCDKYHIYMNFQKIGKERDESFRQRSGRHMTDFVDVAFHMRSF